MTIVPASTDEVYLYFPSNDIHANAADLVKAIDAMGPEDDRRALLADAIRAMTRTIVFDPVRGVASFPSDEGRPDLTQVAIGRRTEVS